MEASATAATSGSARAVSPARRPRRAPAPSSGRELARHSSPKVEFQAEVFDGRLLRPSPTPIRIGGT